MCYRGESNSRMPFVYPVSEAPHQHHPTPFSPFFKVQLVVYGTLLLDLRHFDYDCQ